MQIFYGELVGNAVDFMQETTRSRVPVPTSHHFHRLHPQALLRFSSCNSHESNLRGSHSRRRALITSHFAINSYASTLAATYTVHRMNYGGHWHSSVQVLIETYTDGTILILNGYNAKF